MGGSRNNNKPSNGRGGCRGGNVHPNGSNGGSGGKKNPKVQGTLEDLDTP